MRYAYIGIGVAMLLPGIYEIVSDLSSRTGSLFYGLAAVAGLLWIYFGALNLLNWAYGAGAWGLRITVLAANILMLAVCLLARVEPSSFLERVVAVLVVAATLLSFFPQSLRRSPASTPVLRGEEQPGGDQKAMG